MPAIGLSHYNLRSDRPMLDRLRDFYINVIGLNLGDRPPFRNAGYWLYVGNVDVLHLTEARPDEIRTAHAVNTFHHVAFSCNHRAEFEDRLRAFAIDFTSDRVPQTNLHQLFFSDPAGNGVELNFIETPD